jgi:hypothetical protein
MLMHLCVEALSCSHGNSNNVLPDCLMISFPQSVGEAGSNCDSAMLVQPMLVQFGYSNPAYALLRVLSNLAQNQASSLLQGPLQ